MQMSRMGIIKGIILGNYWTSLQVAPFFGNGFIVPLMDGVTRIQPSRTRKEKKRVKVSILDGISGEKWPCRENCSI